MTNKAVERLPRHFGYVYVLESNDRKTCKIGFSATPERRLKTLRCQHNALRSWVSNLQPDGRALEGKLHKELSLLRSHSEWFSLSFEAAVAHCSSSQGPEVTPEALNSARVADSLAAERMLEFSKSIIAGGPSDSFFGMAASPEPQPYMPVHGCESVPYSARNTCMSPNYLYLLPERYRTDELAWWSRQIYFLESGKNPRQGVGTWLTSLLEFKGLPLRAISQMHNAWVCLEDYLLVIGRRPIRKNNRILPRSISQFLVWSRPMPDESHEDTLLEFVHSSYLVSLLSNHDDDDFAYYDSACYDHHSELLHYLAVKLPEDIYLNFLNSYDNPKPRRNIIEITRESNKRFGLDPRHYPWPIVED